MSQSINVADLLKCAQAMHQLRLRQGMGFTGCFIYGLLAPTLGIAGAALAPEGLGVFAGGFMVALTVCFYWIRHDWHERTIRDNEAVLAGLSKALPAEVDRLETELEAADPASSEVLTLTVEGRDARGHVVWLEARAARHPEFIAVKVGREFLLVAPQDFEVQEGVLRLGSLRLKARVAPQTLDRYGGWQAARDGANQGNPSAPVREA